MMNITDSQILQYVDGLADEEIRKQIELLLPHNDELRQKVEALRASQLPYQGAFSGEEIPAIPNTLLSNIEQLTQLSTTKHSNIQPSSTPLKMVACLVLAFIIGGVTTLSINSLYKTSSDWQHHGSKALVDAMSQYQALYIRDTILTVQQPSEQALAVINEFNTQYDRNVTIADLSSQGYEFRRVQKLMFEDKPIMQMVYLGESGKPLALCITPSDIMNKTTFDYRHADIDSTLWVKQGIAYILMGDKKSHSLETLYASLNS